MLSIFEISTASAGISTNNSAVTTVNGMSTGGSMTIAISNGRRGNGRRWRERRVAEGQPNPEIALNAPAAVRGWCRMLGTSTGGRAVGFGGVSFMARCPRQRPSNPLCMTGLKATC